MTKQKSVVVTPPTSKLAENPSEGLPINEVPLVYVEQLVGVAIGPFVSKIILANENPPHQPTPKLTIAMPTQSLHQMAKQIIELIGNEQTQKQLGDAFRKYQESV